MTPSPVVIPSNPVNPVEPQPHQSQAASNSLKSGPQVLIKNVNGKVTITPVAETGATPVQLDNLLTKDSSSSSKAKTVVNPQLNGRKTEHLRQAMDVQKSHSVPNVNGHVHMSNGANGKSQEDSGRDDDPGKF